MHGPLTFTEDVFTFLPVVFYLQLNQAGLIYIFILYLLYFMTIYVRPTFTLGLHETCETWVQFPKWIALIMVSPVECWSSSPKVGHDRIPSLFPKSP